MRTCIFIKTWKKDLPWLRYCLRSIDKFVTGYHEIVIIADDDCRELDRWTTCDPRIIYVPIHRNGYIFQQIIKLRAAEFTNCELIMYVDSDCAFTKPTTPESFMLEQKPLLLKTRYELVGDGIRWKSITERVVGWPLDYEYMRRLPLFFWRSTVEAFRTWQPQLIPTLYRKTDEAFSEFNAIGAYAERFESRNYSIRDTDNYLPPIQLLQFWSWGGLTNEIRLQIEDVLK